MYDNCQTAVHNCFYNMHIRVYLIQIYGKYKCCIMLLSFLNNSNISFFHQNWMINCTTWCDYKDWDKLLTGEDIISTCTQTWCSLNHRLDYGHVNNFEALMLREIRIFFILRDSCCRFIWLYKYNWTLL